MKNEIIFFYVKNFFIPIQLYLKNMRLISIPKLIDPEIPNPRMDATDS